jgi:hypothetical protein
MRASKLITLSAAALLAGGANLALGNTLQSGSSKQGGSSLSHGSMKSHSIGVPRGAYGRASPRELGGAGTDLITRERTHMREIPRVPSVGTDIRIDALVPRSVRQAAVPLPAAVQRMHPHLRHDRVFIYRDQVVILNPATSRIVAIIKKPG